MESSSLTTETPNANRETDKKRRPRVREVSSRFMSPVVSSSSSGDLHLPSSSSKCPLPNPKHPTIPTPDTHHHPHPHPRSQSVQRRHPSPSHQQPFADDNALRSLDTPFPGKPSAAAASAAVKKRPPAKYSTKENGDPQLDGAKSTNVRFPGRAPKHARSRSDTPAPVLDRSMTSMTMTASTPRSVNFASAATTAAAKLLQSSGLVAPKRSGTQDTSDIDNASVTSAAEDSVSSSSDSCSEVCSAMVCDSPPVPTMSSKIRPVSEFRSSMPEADLLPTMSARRLGEGSLGETHESCRVSASSPCYRSLNAALSSCQQSFSPTKSVNRSSVFSKSNSSSMKMSAVCLPPHPSTTNKSGIEAARKAKKAPTQQEDVHMLRLLHNRYLQWRFANAKADAAMEAQKIVVEKSLNGHVARISELRDSVATKHIELQHLKKMESLSFILDSQIPYLDEWATLEEDYSSSISGAVKALHDASLRLPIIGNVRADVRQLGEALNSATAVLELISPYVESSLPKAEGVENVISELAGVVSKERALIEECGDLLSKAHGLQVEECSLRGHLLQLRRHGILQPKEV
ncbi:hypothetical protein MRB53_028858 [Persea americana]|uniref:Uncharacterized protein n=1 Tax=Persea americana TaxID=3435 RepID=A0ACC2KGQ4_PERAE|nr:hypothetical protein MRB53_028858 [Persea americana]